MTKCTKMLIPYCYYIHICLYHAIIPKVKVNSDVIIIKCLRLISILSFPCRSVGKESTSNAGDLSSIPRLGRSPGDGNSNPLQYSCLENSMEYSPWGCKELEQRHGSVVACYKVGDTECSSSCMGSFEGGHHYLHYLHHSLAPGK